MIRHARSILSLAALTFAACNGYHVASFAARLAGLHALKNASMFDPAALNALIAEYDVHTAS